jgi:hypothetical protein
MDTSGLNSQVRKLLDETGTTIKNQQDLNALSQVSVRELARLFEDIARNLNARHPKKKEEIFSAWKERVVETYKEKTQDPSSIPSKKTTEIEIELDPEYKVLSDDEFLKKQNSIKQQELAVKELSSQVFAAKEEARKAARTGNEAKLQELQRKINELQKKKREAASAADNQRDKSFYKTVFMKKAKNSKLQIKSAPRNSSVPDTITDSDLPVVVDVIKHVYDDQVVLQFDVEKNGDNSKIIENVRIEIPSVFSGIEKAYTDETLKSIDKPDSLFTSFKRTDPHNAIPQGTLVPVLKYTEKDAKTGKTTEVTKVLSPVTLTALDYLADSNSLKDNNLQQEWDKLSPKSELPVSLRFNSLDGLDELLHAIAKSTGLSGFSDAILKDREARRLHSVHEIIKGAKNGRKPLLMKADVKKNDNGEIEANIVIRSDDPKERQLIADAIKQAIQAQIAKNEEQAKQAAQKARQQEMSNASPKLAQKGDPAKTSNHIVATGSGEFQVDVEVVKHTHKDSVVFQFLCVNKENYKQLKNAFVVQDLEHIVGLTPDFVLPADELKYNEEISIYCALNRTNYPDFPTGIVTNTLKFTVEEGTQKRDGFLLLQDIDLSTIDFIKPLAVADFDKEWKGAESNESGARGEILQNGGSIQQVVDELVSSTGLHTNPLSSSHVPDGKSNHVIKFAGVSVDGDTIFARADVRAGVNGVPSLEVATRSGNNNLPRKLSKDLLNLFERKTAKDQGKTKNEYVTKRRKEQEDAETKFDDKFHKLGPASHGEIVLDTDSPLQAVVDNFIAHSGLTPVGDTDKVKDSLQHTLKLQGGTDEKPLLIEAKFDARDPNRLDIDVAVKGADEPKRTGQINNLVKKFDDLIKQPQAAQRTERAKNLFDSILSKVPQLKDKGIPFSSSNPIIITDSDDDLHVEVIKHAYPDCLVVQYDITNKNPDMDIEDVWTENDLSWAVHAVKTGDTKSGPLKDNQTGTVYAIIGSDEPNSLPFGQIGTKFELESGGNTYEMKVEDFSVTPMDFVKDAPDTNFTKEWDKLAKLGEGTSAVEYPNRVDLQDMINKLVDSSTLSPCNSTKATNNNHHVIQFAGKLPNGDHVLVEATVDRTNDDIKIDLIGRSPFVAAREGVAQGMLIELASKMKESLRFEEDMENPYFRDIFSKIPALKKLGAPHSSKAPVLISQPNADLTVRVIKHTWVENIVLQFECTSVKPDLELENVMVESQFEESEELSKQFYVQAGLLTYDVPDFVFMTLEKDRESFPLCSVANILSFDKVKINPQTGEHTGESIVDQTIDNLEEVEILLTDYLSSKSNTDFASTWETLGSGENQSQSKTTLNKNLQESIDYIKAKADMEPIARDGNKFKFIGRLHTGVEVLFEAVFTPSGNNTSVTVTARSEEPFLRQIVDILLN